MSPFQASVSSSDKWEWDSRGCFRLWELLAPGGVEHCPHVHLDRVSPGRRRNVNSLKNVVIWYEDHKHRCPYEPHLAELDPTFGLYTTAVWQCEAGHRYFQDLHSPLKPLSDSEPDSDKGGSAGKGMGTSRHGALLCTLSRRTSLDCPQPGPTRTGLAKPFAETLPS